MTARPKPKRGKTARDYLAGALAMQEKIARAVSMSPRKHDQEVAAHIRLNIKPPTATECAQYANASHRLEKVK